LVLGIYKKSKSKNHHWFWVFEKKKNPRIKELPGPGRYMKKKSESKISDKCPEPANSDYPGYIPGI